MNGVVLWVAQGFYIGRIPFAPGSFGSVLGLLWLAALLTTGGWGYSLGLLGGAALSVWICGRAERILGQTDPSSVVVDEIIAIPLCYASWIGDFVWRHGTWPTAPSLVTQNHWLTTVAILLTFRFFDIVKPWPVRQSQVLPGGWGVTVDDQLAAVYVNLTVLAVLGIRLLTGGSRG